MADEPRRHPWYMVLVAVISIGTAPIWFAGRATVFVFGFPLWLVSSTVFTLALSGLTVWGIGRYWKDDRID